ncbi:hypothetical protein M2277_004960 [Paenibacillus sp. LBL]|uniref:DUF7352 domain-containing protein n=1 Tax=Paenibacillus sp. LBL TaxID=2940563 RepID=UPI002474635C|nr:hypothetical protein [Paenibacillus sp. LBL]MDH6674268.1 hypothetical protein [Paenibacillus sp. LBL]
MMHYTIHKYDLPFVRNTIEFPIGSKVISVKNQRERIVAYVMVPVDQTYNDSVEIEFLVVGTGWTISNEDYRKYHFIDTVMTDNDQLVSHVFAKTVFIERALG